MRASWLPAVALVVVVVVVRLVAVSLVELGDDEAYYWLWAQRPALSYFDHPGGVAWSIAASTAVFGDTPLAVRLPTVIAEGGLALLVGNQADARHRLPAVALALFLPVLGLIGVFAAPDAALLLLWFAAVAVARRLPADPSPRRWALVGVLVGASLLFKLTGVLLAGGLVLWSAVDARRRAWWTTAGPWLAAALMVVVASPSLVWNALYDWPTVRFHAVGRHTHSVGMSQGLLTWLGVHLVLLTPPVLWGVVKGARRPEARVWIWVAAPCWVVFTLAALVTPVKLHWWAPAWVTILPVALPALASVPRVRAATIGATALLHGAVLVLAVAPVGPLALATAELRGWRALAHSLHEDHPAVRAWVTPRYQTSAQLAWGARDLAAPPILRLTGRADQFTMWGEDRVPEAGPVLLVCASHLPCTPRDVPALSCTGPQSTRPVHHEGGRVIRTFSVWQCAPAG